MSIRLFEVPFEKINKAKINDIVKVKITKAKTYTLEGEEVHE